ncbi:heparinase II/III domain-containing protein [Jeotgalicoccus meleagridis]|uniref:Heparinase II/III-like protein n=1 Tax=Jeotgalicoccus meleagridis TaxID=2759181 RepID=A0A6V7RKZ6_9STAP|nr:heparinase II/III family protein [Jeotgalicoccus meleagridis]CAD2078937.1 Heparinase II/III-like protein [Jeotgalicoccus meleagridis]
MIQNKYKGNLKIYEDDVYRLFEVSNRREKMAEDALNNIITPFPGFLSTEFRDDMWLEKKKQKYGNSYSLYLHTLRITVELMLAYEETNDIKYFDKAEEIIESWIRQSEPDKEVPMKWYDHTTANRTQALIQYLYLAQQMGRKVNISKYVDLLRKHVEVMSDDSKYKTNNHGLMMDRSLVVLGYVLEDHQIISKGKNRAINTFWYSFSSQAIHLENSPHYHLMVVRMYNEIEAYLNRKEDSLGPIIVNYLKLAKEYIPKLSKPNNTLPAIGDSGTSKAAKKKVYKNIYDYEAGIAILQYEQPNPMYLSFVAGYSSRVHKHNDDLSITLNYKTKDFLIDPGKYSYTGNKTRSYITSRRAHSSFYLEGFNYKIKNENRYDRKVRLENYVDNKIYSLVKGVNGDYEGTNALLERIVIQFKNSPVNIIVDSLITKRKNELKMTQKYNLSSLAKVSEVENGYKLISGGEELVIKQFKPFESKEVINGDLKKPVAVNTSGFAKVRPTKQLAFRKTSNQKEAFLTAIYDDRIVNDFDLKLYGDRLIVFIEDKTYDIYL